MPSRTTSCSFFNSSSDASNSRKATSPSSVSRPRIAFAIASSVSWISFSMKCAKPPFCAWVTSQSTWTIFGLTVTPSSVETSAPRGVTAATSPSPNTRTRFVYGMIAVMSDAT